MKNKTFVTSIHQPSYYPWQGLLHKINSSDLFIVMDEVQLQDRGFQHRNLFLNTLGEVHTLTIPIQKKHYREKMLKDILLCTEPWQKKHANFIYHNYHKHPYFEEVYSQIETLYTKNYTYLFDVLLDTIVFAHNFLDMKTEIRLQSSLNYDKSAKKEELIYELLQATDSHHYLSGHGAKFYQKPENFQEKKIQLTYTDYKYKPYSQYKNAAFKPGLCALDLFFNVGKEAKNYI